MIALAIAGLLAAQAGSVALPEPEITVLAHRLEAVSVVVSRDEKGRMSCGMNQSSGDVRIDAKLCETAARCVKKGAVERDAVKACIDRRKPDLLREFAANMRAGAS